MTRPATGTWIARYCWAVAVSAQCGHSRASTGSRGAPEYLTGSETPFVRATWLRQGRWEKGRPFGFYCFDRLAGWESWLSMSGVSAATETNLALSEMVFVADWSEATDQVTHDQRSFVRGLASIYRFSRSFGVRTRRCPGHWAIALISHHCRRQ